jgi:hypothetical protein
MRYDIFSEGVFSRFREDGAERRNAGSGSRRVKRVQARSKLGKEVLHAESRIERILNPSVV